MAVRVPSVEMVDRDPVELCAEILFHLSHHVAGEAAKILQAVTILRRDDEPELVAVISASVEETMAICEVGIRSIQRSTFRPLASCRHVADSANGHLRRGCRTSTGRSAP